MNSGSENTGGPVLLCEQLLREEVNDFSEVRVLFGF